MAKSKKMLCLMIVNHSKFEDPLMNRKDAIEPARKLKSALEKCCACPCDVKLMENLKAKQMQSAVADVVDRSTACLADYDSVWLVLSSHGDWKYFPNCENPHQADVIWGTDTTIPIYLLTKHLQKTGKPCAIVVQACRGDQMAAVYKIKVDEKGDVISSEVTKDKMRSDRDRTGKAWSEINSYCDNQIMLCSSLPGNKSFRRGLFEYLTQVLQDEDLKKTDVESLFAKTCKKVDEEFSSKSDDCELSDRKVVAVFNNRLRSELFLK